MNNGRFTEEIKESARHLRGDVREAAGVIREDLEDVARRAGYRAREFADRAQYTIQDAESMMADKVRQHPLKWVLLSLGFGMVLGRLIRGK